MMASVSTDLQQLETLVDCAQAMEELAPMSSNWTELCLRLISITAAFINPGSPPTCALQALFAR